MLVLCVFSHHEHGDVANSVPAINFSEGVLSSRVGQGGFLDPGLCVPLIFFQDRMLGPGYLNKITSFQD
jgi:hypothetical protein